MKSLTELEEERARAAHAERREALARAVAPAVVAAAAATTLEPGESVKDRPRLIARAVRAVTDAILEELDQ